MTESSLMTAEVAPSEAAAAPGEAAVAREVPGGQPAVSVGCAMLIGTNALMILGVQPLLLGALTEEGRLSVAAIGRLAMVEVLALAVGSAVGSRIMIGDGIRNKTSLACAVLALANFGTYLAHSPIALFGLRAAAGCVEGLALGVTIVILTHTRHPGRVNGLFLGLQTIPQMIAAYFLPVMILPHWGANAGFGLLGAFALASIPGAFWLKSPVRNAIASTRDPWHRLPGVAIALGAIIVQNAGIGGAWNYIEVVAAEHRFGSDSIGIAMSASLACQVAGALFVAWIGWRAPHRIVLWIAISLQMIITAALARPTSAALYITEACAFGLLWLALQPFQIRQLITLDPARHAALLVTPLTLAGLSLGPFCVSFAVRPGNVSGAFWVSAILFAISAMLFELATQRARHGST